MSKPTWFKPAFERPDNREFKIGEMVKCAEGYCYVLEDNRPKSYCTYTYTLLPVEAKEEIDQSGDMGVIVYCHYPRDIETCNSTENVLYHNDTTWQYYFNRFKTPMKFKGKIVDEEWEK